MCSCHVPLLPYTNTPRLFDVDGSICSFYLVFAFFSTTMNPRSSPGTSPTKPAPSKHSPRPSTDSHHPPASPFLHNLTSRLRKGSNASSYSAGENSAEPQDPITKTESTRSARRAVLSLVRNDWEYPPATTADSGSPKREPAGYRIREESFSDLEAEEIFSRRRTKNDPYKFENPDSIGAVVTDRKRKRQHLLEEELTWNEGLRTWSERRDAWTGAVKQKPRSHLPHSSRSHEKESRHHKSRLSQSMTHQRNASGSTDGSWPLSPSSTVAGESSSIDSTADGTSAPNDPNNPFSEQGPWLPIYPPLIPEEDSVRLRIRPAAYTTIYSKIVVQSLSPNVPIPLTHMIPALVEGWKSEGNWPPPPSALIPQDMKKGRKSSTFLRWRKEHQAEIKGAEAATYNEDGRSRVRRSIGLMKKVLGAGGHNDDDGLQELGIEFRQQDAVEMEKNVTLNKALV